MPREFCRRQKSRRPCGGETVPRHEHWRPWAGPGQNGHCLLTGPVSDSVTVIGVHSDTNQHLSPTCCVCWVLEQVVVLTNFHAWWPSVPVNISSLSFYVIVWPIGQCGGCPLRLAAHGTRLPRTGLLINSVSCQTGVSGFFLPSAPALRSWS